MEEFLKTILGYHLMYRVKEDLKAWRRGEVRVAPGMRGRVYARKNGESMSNAMTSGHRTNVKVGAVVTRADGSIERYEIRNGKPVRTDQSLLVRLSNKLKEILRG